MQRYNFLQACFHSHRPLSLTGARLLLAHRRALLPQCELLRVTIDRFPKGKVRCGKSGSTGDLNLPSTVRRNTHKKYIKGILQTVNVYAE